MAREEDADLKREGRNVQTTGCGIYHVQKQGEKKNSKGRGGEWEWDSEWSNAWSVASGQLRKA